MSESTSRRSFFTKGVAAGAAAVMAGSQAEAAPKKNRKLKIGVIGLGHYSFMTWSWADIIESMKPGSPRGSLGTPFLNMEITHAWDKDPKAAEEFAKRLDAKAVKKYDEMVGKIDGLILADFDDVGIQHKLAKPYVEAGIPTYLSRPFSFCLRDIDELLETAAKHNTPIMATAKYEHYKEAPALKSKLGNVGTIKLVQADTFTLDFPVHFHIQFMMLKILGYDVKKVAMMTDHDMKSTYVQETYLYPGKGDQPPFLCTINGASIPDSFHIRVVGDKGIETASMLRGYDWKDSLLYRYAPQVIDMQRTFEGHNYEPYDIVRKKTEIFLTGYYSYLERGGAPVDVGSVPVDWRVNSPNIKSTKVDLTPYSK